MKAAEKITPLYTIKALSDTWETAGLSYSRTLAIDSAKQMATEKGLNHHVYMTNKNGQTSHVFTARAPVLESA